MWLCREVRMEGHWLFGSGAAEALGRERQTVGLLTLAKKEWSSLSWVRQCG